MGSHRLHGQRRSRRSGRRPVVLASTIALALVAAILSAAPFAPGDGFARPAAAQTATSTYCENIDDSDIDNGPTANGGGVLLDVEVIARDLDTSTPLTDFSYLVNLDNTGRGSDPIPERHPAVKPMASHSPVVAAGDEASTTFAVPTGCRYLVTVRAPGYKLWGGYVELPAGTTGPQSVTIDLLDDPAPLSQLVVQVFEDIGTTNGQPDFPLDTPLAGFHITVDAGGENIVGLDGSALCQDVGNDCVTDADGQLTIIGLPFGNYEIHAIPPDGSNYIQTTTIEGTQALDVWLDEGNDGLGNERALLNEPGQLTSHWFGFVQVDESAPAPACPVAACGDVTGRALNYLVTPPFEASVPQPNEPVNRPYIAVNNTGDDDTVERVIRGNADGTFSIPNLPPGEYQLAIWDFPLHYIMGFYTVVVPPGGGAIDMGDLGIWRWFGWMSGYVYLDNGIAQDGTTITTSNSVLQTSLNPVDPGNPFANNGIRDCYDDGDGLDPFDHPTCELGLPGEEVLIKFRDGSVFKGGVTDGDGFYEFPAVRGPLGRYVVPEVGFARRNRTGHSVHPEFTFGGYDPYPSLPVPGDKGGDLLLAGILWEGHRSWIDWGKSNYDLTDPEDNGGIAGAVLYGVTINEVEPALAGQEDYEGGIPNVPLRLWNNGADGIPNTDDDELMVELSTDAWSHPSDGDGPQPQTVWSGGNDTPCNLLDNTGAPVADPNDIAGRCLEVPAQGNETQDGAWDGGFAFEDDCSAGINGGVAVLRGDPAAPASNYNAPAGTWTIDEGACTHIVPGDYVAQVLVPEFYQVIMEESVNTDEGVEFEPALPPPPCVGEDHLVMDERSPADGTLQPLCDRKLVRLAQGQNAAVEFTIYTECPAVGGPSKGGCATDRTLIPGVWDQRWSTDPVGNADEPVPLPARFYGFSEDGVTVDNDPASLTYGEKFGVPNIPIGIYDYTGRHLTTVHTDENGYYEFLVPSSYTVSCPTPAGLCPGMYRFIPNDPGDPLSPNSTFDPSYLTQPWVFQALPNKMRHADTPLFPISAIECQVEQGSPQLLLISDVYMRSDAAAPLNVTITGTGFEDGAGPPSVELIDSGGTSTPLAIASFTPSDEGAATPVFEDVVEVTVPTGLAEGVYQLEMTADGFTTVNGISFHVLSPTATVIPVVPTASLDLGLVQPIQAAVNGAVAGDFIDVQPGVYRENVIVDVPGITIQGHGPGGVIGNVVPEPGDDAAQPPADPPFSGITGTTIDSRYFLGDGDAQDLWTARAPAGAPAAASISLFEADAVLIDGFGIGFGRGEAGGGVYAHPGSSGVTVSNNVIAHAVGEHGGAVVLGRPAGFGGPADNDTGGATIANNRILQSGGVSFAGQIGIFAGSDGYVVTQNDICGGFGLEYGGGISHFGTSEGGEITDNRIFYNTAFDEGGGVLIAGETRPGTPDPIFTPSGDVLLDANEISFNLSNDDGGGVRLLAPRESRIDITNNFINHNAATDHGAGLALDDASNVFIVNNTVVENATTSTSEDAEDALPASATCAPAAPGQATCPRGAGLTSTMHSINFTPTDGSTFSDPVLDNNIFWNNESFFWGDTGGGETGLVSAGMWDMEVLFIGGPGCFTVTNSFLSTASGPNDTCDYTGSAGTSIGVDPLVNTDLVEYGLSLLAGPSLVGGDAILIEIERTAAGPQGAEGPFFVDLVDMHLQAGSPAIDAGGDPTGTVPGLVADIDGEARPAGPAYDVGADEFSGAVVPLRSTYMAFDCGPLGGIASCLEDTNIYRWDGNPTYTLVFDGGDVLTSVPAFGDAGDPFFAAIDGFVFLSDTEILISFRRQLRREVFGITTGGTHIDDSDILIFTAEELGDDTEGTWDWYFDASDVGLDGHPEDIDAVGLTSEGNLLISTLGTTTAGGLTWEDEDVVEFEFTGAPGRFTTGTFSLFMDGIDADAPPGSGLDTNAEDIDALGVDPINEDDLYISTIGRLQVDEGSGARTVAQDEDIVTCVTTGALPIVCDDWDLYLDGSGPDALIEPYDTTGLDIRSGPVLP